MSRHSLILELHVLPFLDRVRKESDAADLGAVPGDYLREIRRRGFDAVWLMGVWERSPSSRMIALDHSALKEEYDRFNPKWTPEQVTGSPYSIHRYVPDSRLGGWEALARFRQKANHLGLKVLLDFVPNHLACDHPWTTRHPEYFVGITRPPEGDESNIFFKAGSDHWIAHGKDPYFPAWTDTAQVNYFSTEARAAMTEELIRVVSACDGVRCDMAMLPLNEVFGRTWGRWVKPSGAYPEFWVEAIRAAKTRFPHAIFVAEVYWGLESLLLEQGFDRVYDKSLYDSLLSGDVGRICGCLRAGQAGDRLRFTENHDERRAKEAFGPERSFAASVIALSGPGMSLIHQGQESGATRKAPVQIGVWPDEESDEALAQKYAALLGFLSDGTVKEGEYDLPEPFEAWSGNGSYTGWVIQSWKKDSRMAIAAVNFSDHPAQARIRLGEAALSRPKLYFKDLMDGKYYERSAEVLRREGLFMDLGAWGVHLFITDL